MKKRCDREGEALLVVLLFPVMPGSTPDKKDKAARPRIFIPITKILQSDNIRTLLP